MPNNGHNKNHSKGRRRNPRHKKDFQDRDRAPTFTDEDTISKSDLEIVSSSVKVGALSLSWKSFLCLGFLLLCEWFLLCGLLGIIYFH